MTPELKQEYTRRITSANRTGIIVITYEIALGYLSDSKEAAEKGNTEECRVQLRNACRCVEQLLAALNFDYALSLYLMRIYNYVLECIRKVSYSMDIGGLEEPEKILKKLKSSFEEVARSDDSPPMMSGADEVYDGLTYNARGKTNINTVRR
ncbi:MAG: flagellar protein FliS [Lachnospiraceae bacterium]|nr:flagellar protein FliS [Lachnospiraceae bacterium]